MNETQPLEIQKGDLVFLKDNAVYNSTTAGLKGIWDPANLNLEGPFEVRNVTRHTVSILLKGRSPHYGVAHTIISLYKEYVFLVGEHYTPPRKPGEKPVGEEFIGQDHPGIQWLWDDLAKYAEDANWCKQYDKLAEAVNIPGRLQPFKLTRKLGALSVSATIKARSKSEAEDLFDQQLSKEGLEPVK